MWGLEPHQHAWCHVSLLVEQEDPILGALARPQKTGCGAQESRPKWEINQAMTRPEAEPTTWHLMVIAKHKCEIPCLG